MPHIKIEMLSGRTLDQKRALVKAVTHAFVSTCGSTPDGVQIIIKDIDKENWATSGLLHIDDR